MNRSFPLFNRWEYDQYAAKGEVVYMRDKSALAKAYMRAHPGEFLRLSAVRFFRFWTGTGNKDGSVIFTLHAVLTTSLGFMGIWRWCREGRVRLAVLFLLPLMVFPLPYYITHAEFRYRLVDRSLAYDPGRVCAHEFSGLCGETMTLERAPAVWLRWALPSFADLFFLVLLGILAFSPMSAGLLGDADTGWHIRSGEQILATHAIPRTDPFSYTRHGEPWYAWEWMYDVVIAAIHHVSGLNGVVLFTAAVISVTFALLFRFILRRSGNLAVAAFLTLLAAAAAQVHMLARPHVLSWLFTLLWVENLCRFEDGERSALLWLPPLMLLWVNLHAGFILGLGLLGIFALGAIWRSLTAPRGGDRER